MELRGPLPAYAFRPGHRAKSARRSSSVGTSSISPSPGFSNNEAQPAQQFRGNSGRAVDRPQGGVMKQALSARIGAAIRASDQIDWKRRSICDAIVIVAIALAAYALADRAAIFDSIVKFQNTY